MCCKKKKAFPRSCYWTMYLKNLTKTVLVIYYKEFVYENEGQVFITDTNEERLKQHLEVIKVDYQLIAL